MSTVLVPGTVVAGRYTVGERLGAGGTGVVHRARDTVLPRDVALEQVLLPDDRDPSGSDGSGPAATRRLRREAAVAAQLHHGRIVTVFDVLELDGGPLLIMENVPAESLKALLLRSGPLPSGVAARIGAQVAPDRAPPPKRPRRRRRPPWPTVYPAAHRPRRARCGLRTGAPCCVRRT
ncbi:hypothetical protein [Pseudonocardia sp. McavD-2-B]|uniref:protein kinase domain-containing protein n=1 Tax=Pseudonocardia sp. McavD-2-B TaxID=2954499 RepID=UPI0020985BEC|nr:hypothetical protein [Pseudonocardia sp. McavD-2-B]MCO7193080.1 hypothetical protein [Pseudonocardia sp. McavD-2-B]